MNGSLKQAVMGRMEKSATYMEAGKLQAITQQSYHAKNKAHSVELTNQ